MTPSANPSSVWSPGAAELRATERDDLVQLGVWMFLATVTMLFAAFTSAYIVRRAAADWVAIELPPMLWANTAVLLASSAVLEGGRLARRRRRRVARSMLAAATLMGLAFLGGQIAAWRTLAAQGLYLPSGPHAAFVYLLTGLHGVHVVAGLTLLGAAAWRSWPAGGRHGLEPPPTLLNAAAAFWHFLAALWVWLFLLVGAF
jgi:cytochrome c oxidase subunit 3